MIYSILDMLDIMWSLLIWKKGKEVKNLLLSLIISTAEPYRNITGSNLEWKEWFKELFILVETNHPSQKENQFFTLHKMNKNTKNLAISGGAFLIGVSALAYFILKRSPKQPVAARKRLSRETLIAILNSLKRE